MEGAPDQQIFRQRVDLPPTFNEHLIGTDFFFCFIDFKIFFSGSILFIGLFDDFSILCCYNVFPVFSIIKGIKGKTFVHMIRNYFPI